MKTIINIKSSLLKMFIESVQYSLQSARIVIKNLKDEQIMLPISTVKDKVRCLDFDMDKVVFTSTPKSQVKLVEINPYNKSWLEVLDMV
jgi:hypothetical protein